MRSKRFHLLSSCLCSLEMDQERLSFLYLQDLNKDCSLRRLRIEIFVGFQMGSCLSAQYAISASAFCVTATACSNSFAGRSVADLSLLDAFLCLVMDEFNPIDHTDFVCTNIAAESLTFRLVVFLHVSIFQLVLQHFSNLHRNVPAANCNLTVFFIVSRLQASNTSTRRNHTGKHQTCCAVVQRRIAKLCVLKSFCHLQILVHGHGLLGTFVPVVL